jgi:lipopolysaccharide transport system permease protein
VEENVHTVSSSARSDHPAPVSDETVVEGSHGWPSLRLGELWRSHELLYFLVWREVKVRYAQTALGVAWAVLQPLLTVVVFTVFFNRVAHITTNGTPYPVFVLAGLVPWLFFANGVTTASSSLVANTNLLTKVYFPRLVIPTASTVSGLPDFVIAFGLLLLVMAGYGVAPAAAVAAVVLVLLLVLATCLGVAIWLSALNVEYRDVRYLVPFLVQLWLLATPVAYPAAGLRQPWSVLIGLNPMAGAIELFRFVLLGTSAPPTATVVLSTAVALAILVTGTYHFRFMERRFADVI